MAAGFHKRWCWVLTIISILAGFFFLAASLFMLGLSSYKLFAHGGSMSGPEAAWDVLAPAWPLYLITLVLGLVGWFAFRKLNAEFRGESSERVGAN